MGKLAGSPGMEKWNDPIKEQFSLFSSEGFVRFIPKTGKVIPYNK